jgi:O-antigen ligase
MTPRVQASPFRIPSGASAASRPVEAPETFLEKLGFLFLCTFLYVAFSRLTDFVPYLHLPLVTALLAIGATVLSGGIQRAAASTCGKLLLAFTAWFVITIPFSVWRGGSFEVFKEVWSKSLLTFIVIVGLSRTLTHCRRMMLVIAASGLTVALASLLFGQQLYGRVVMAVGSLANPNAVGHILLFSLPFFGVAAVSRSVYPFRWVLVLLAAIPIVVVLGMTGSRGSLIALFVLFTAIFLHVSIANKLKLLGLGLVAVILAVAFMPGALMERYRTIFHVDETYISEGQRGALESTNQRRDLLKDSLRLTFQHPVFGVGPGQFQVAAADDAKSRNEPAKWRETHNTYTQVSSEMGIPGFLLYFAVPVIYFRDIWRIRKECGTNAEWKEIRQMANCLLLGLLGVAVAGLFGNMAYGMTLPALAGVSVAFSSTARQAVVLQNTAKSNSAPLAGKELRASGPHVGVVLKVG